MRSQSGYSIIFRSQVLLVGLSVALFLPVLGCGNDGGDEYSLPEFKEEHGRWSWLGTADGGTDYYYYDRSMIDINEDGNPLVWIKNVDISDKDKEAYASGSRDSPDLGELPHFLMHIELRCSEQKYKILEVSEI